MTNEALSATGITTACRVIATLVTVLVTLVVKVTSASVLAAKLATFLFVSFVAASEAEIVVIAELSDEEFAELESEAPELFSAAELNSADADEM
ncbi:hypothetical protein FD13_GL000229 [Levilactobacillus senmaizukei DSM 21775 = NBRC 103853]|uniref:Uncharacterized protein n=1 Tax=Levilactobacillus senmaizukei DSM 21775 = NBRC 103853 TaxID=1423803 RepID=A0A0R2DPF1_9LACO|nr:hypothetical protein FD13_GL000229 [Levilactobacillus senmaizukei DSM 21775 = NBRC 103853]